jgi:tetratricopeptide (TPR) repeat protein
VSDRLVLDIDADGRATVSVSVDNDLPGVVGDPFPLAWPVDAEALEDLRWYLEEYLLVPYGVYGEKGPDVAKHVRGWGEAVFAAVFGSGAGRDAYVQMREGELVIRSASPAALGLPWELMRDPDRPGPLALDFGAVARALPATQLGKPFSIAGERLRVLMVISRPSGAQDVGYRMVARPLIERLEAVRGEVDLVVLRPPTLEALKGELLAAREDGRPYQVVHFDGHGVLAGRGVSAGMGPPATFAGPAGEGVLIFEKPTGGADEVRAASLASVLSNAEIPVVVLNACQSGAVGKELEAAIATRLLQEGTSSVVAMAYTVFAVAAAEFMAAFYERLFVGDTISGAVSAGRRRLAERPDRPSPKGKMPLEDWLVPVHYLRRDVHFPGLRRERPQPVSLDTLLDSLRSRSEDTGVEALDAVGTFVGRDALFYDLEVATRHRRAVIVHGPGGTGKTELAKAFGRWWRDTGAIDDPDWVIFHSFEPGSATFGLAGVMDKIGLSVFGAAYSSLEHDERRAVIEDLLQKRRLLLVWDNFESIHTMPDPTGATPALDDKAAAELRSFVAKIAAGGATSLVITSRSSEPWLGDVPRIAVGGLTPDEAIEYADWLLAPHPKAQQKRADPAFAALLDWLDGHPLSMRLVLPHLETTEPSSLLSSLQGIADPLVDDVEDTGRTTSLNGSITYSYDHLSQAAQQLLVALCAFHGVADAELLRLMSDHADVPERFRGVSHETWISVLSQAANVGLLSPLGADLFRIHPAFPRYLATRWRQDSGGDDERQATEAVLLDAYAALGRFLSEKVHSEDAAFVFQLIGLQRPGLGKYLQRALAERRWRQAQSIGEPLDAFFTARGLDEEARRWVDRTRLAVESDAGDPPPLDSPAGALWLFHVGAQANRTRAAGQLDVAERTYTDILVALEAQPESDKNDRRLAVTYHQLGMIAQRHGKLEDAEEWYRRSLAIEERLGSKVTIASSYHQLGIVAHRRRDLDEAEESYKRSVALRDEVRDLPGLASGYHQLGMLAHDRERWDEADEWYRRSLAIEEQLQNLPGIASSYHQLGVAAQDQGRLDESEEWQKQSLAIHEQLRNLPGIATSYHQLGILAFQRTRLDEAEKWFHQSRAIEERVSNFVHLASSYHHLGLVAFRRKRWDEAAEWHRRSLAMEEAVGNEPGMAVSYLELGHVALCTGQLEEADDWCGRSLELSEREDLRSEMARGRRLAGFIADARGDRVLALDWMIRCVTTYDDPRHPAIGSAIHHLARLTGELGSEVLDSRWRAITGEELPDGLGAAVDKFIASQPKADEQ